MERALDLFEQLADVIEIEPGAGGTQVPRLDGEWCSRRFLGPVVAGCRTLSVVSDVHA